MRVDGRFVISAAMGTAAHRTTQSDVDSDVDNDGRGASGR